MAGMTDGRGLVTAPNNHHQYFIAKGPKEKTQLWDRMKTEVLKAPLVEDIPTPVTSYTEKLTSYLSANVRKIVNFGFLKMEVLYPPTS